ncbi:hypothetical protein C5167_022585 [Papaver somniferum]|uniref:Uncharacterized protein n=1 Tax=Papaver somniferum TaxID=3469 RepID=A0A4Y7JME1_PAPSO|nr:hypothetical protein C5167_022585 [Papaver somniferum]
MSVCIKVVRRTFRGSEVRSISFVSKKYFATVDHTYITQECGSSLDDRDNQLLLISVGGKRVLTSWLL